MPASNAAVGKIAHILIEECGPLQATKIVERIAAEVEGNKSFMETVKRLVQYFATYWNSRGGYTQ